jgi:hypothetical protein
MYDNVKGEHILTQAIVGQLVKRWGTAFTPQNNAIELRPRTIKTERAKVDLTFVPLEFESNYRGALKQKGQNPYDFPFAAFIYNLIREKVKEEIESAAWLAEKTGSPTSTDALALLFDGFHEIIGDAVTATTLTPVVTGALTTSNTVSAVETCVKGLGEAYLNSKVDVFLNPVDCINYVQNYRGTFGMHNLKTPENNQNFMLDFGNVTVHSLTGVKKNSILVTPASNLAIAVDAEMDSEMINFQNHVREIYAWCDFRYGVNFHIMSNKCMVVNDQH